MNTKDFCKQMAKEFNNISNVRFVADMMEVEDSVTVVFSYDNTKKAKVVAKTIEGIMRGISNTFKDMNVALIGTETMAVFYNFSKHSAEELTKTIADIIFQLRYTTYESEWDALSLNKQKNRVKESKVSVKDIDNIIKELVEVPNSVMPSVSQYRELIRLALRIEDDMSESAVRKEYGGLTVGEWLEILEAWRIEGLAEKKSLKETKVKWTVYDFIAYLVKNKILDDIISYVDFYFKIEDFDKALRDCGYKCKFIRVEDIQGSRNGVPYEIYQYKIDDEIYRIWVSEDDTVFNGCIKY